MEKLVAKGQAEQPSTAKVLVWIVFLTGGSTFSLLLAVQSQALSKDSPGGPCLARVLPQAQHGRCEQLCGSMIPLYRGLTVFW